MFTYSKYGHVNKPDGEMQFNVREMQFNVRLHLINFENFPDVHLVRRTAFIYTYFSKKFVCVKLGDFSSKNCKLSFFVQYIAVGCRGGLHYTDMLT